MNRSFGTRGKRVAFDHPSVRQLIAGQVFSIGAAAEWWTCSGEPIGVNVEILLTEPVTFEADLPVVTFRKDQSTAYLEGVARWRVVRNVWFRILVDLNREQVVAIFPEGEPSDLSRGKKRKTKIDMESVGPLHPAGGPDSGSCVQEGD